MNLTAAILLTVAAHGLYADDNAYDVLRNGEVVGEHRLIFAGDGERLTATARTRAEIVLLGGLIRAPFQYDSRAVWSGDTLLEITASYDQFMASGEAAAVLRDGEYAIGDGRRRAPAPLFPTNHWHAGALRQQRVFNTLSGEVADVRIANAGKETIRLADGDRTATRHEYRGGFNADVWHDEDGRWVKLRFESFGDVYEFVCRRCSP